MRTYLVTGGAGFIGSNNIHYMLKKIRQRDPHHQRGCLHLCGQSGESEGCGEE